jgi:hypothetical protein
MRPDFDFEHPPEPWHHGPGFWHQGHAFWVDAPSWLAVPFFLVTLAAYFVPTLVAYRRRHHDRVAIALLNLFLGWTFFGWVAALVWAATAVKRSDPHGN